MIRSVNLYGKRKMFNKTLINNLNNMIDCNFKTIEDQFVSGYVVYQVWMNNSI